MSKRYDHDTAIESMSQLGSGYLLFDVTTAPVHGTIEQQQQQQEPKLQQEVGTLDERNMLTINLFSDGKKSSRQNKERESSLLLVIVER